MLKYLGKNGEFIPHIPARDLDDRELSALALKLGYAEGVLIDLLCKRGLYASVAATTPESVVIETKSPKISKRKKGE